MAIFIALSQNKAQTLIQKQPSILEGCFFVYAWKPAIHAGSGLFLFLRLAARRPQNPSGIIAIRREYPQDTHFVHPLI